ncbi:unnamed protein product [Strongylus vulgaris]|uniref:CNNM transmembrane domain-containing protein n=1 Tax=Strongylus vulgaris TaxID=40348 RepID=A0A3P7IT87_STRVU|nr:unnamed protein product [Strongylus vulgaris]
MQSLCNRIGLKLAARTRHITLLLFIICAPVAYPLSRIIDYVLGREVREIYSEEKLKTLIKVQSKKMEEAAQGDILARIAEFPKKTVQDMMTPIEDAFIVSGGDTLDLKDLATTTIDRRWKVHEVVSRSDDARSQMRFVLATQKGEAVMQEMMKGCQKTCK